MYASVECIQDGSIIPAGQIEYTVYPNFDLSLLQDTEGNCTTAPDLTSTCTNYVITGAGSNQSGIPSPNDSGMNSYTIIYDNSSDFASCFNETVTVDYDCPLNCPNVTTAILESENICSGSTPDIVTAESTVVLSDPNLAIQALGTPDVGWWTNSSFTIAYDEGAINHTGDACNSETVILYATIECLQTGMIIPAGQFTVIVYPLFDASLLNLVQGDCTTPPSLTSTCGNYDIALANDSDDITTTPGPGDSGVNNYTVTYDNGSGFSSCFNEAVPVSYNCNLSCPSVDTAIAETENVCSGNTPDLTSAESTLVLSDPSLVVQSGGAVAISWWLNANLMTDPFGGTISHSGSTCDSEIVILYASVECIQDGSTILAGEFEFTVYPDMSTFDIVADTDACIPSPISWTCEGEIGYTLEFSPTDTTNLSDNGMITYTIVNNNVPSSITGTVCNEYEEMFDYFCGNCPSLATLELPDLCSGETIACLLYTSPSPRDATLSRMPSSA